MAYISAFITNLFLLELKLIKVATKVDGFWP